MALIIAVTYGGRVRRAFTEFARLGGMRVSALSGDQRSPKQARKCVLQRHLDAECMTPQGLAAAAAPDLDSGRCGALLEGSEPSSEELEVLARALNVKLSDLYVSGMTDAEDAVITRSADSRAQARRLSTYTLAPLARTRHQPDLKTFDLEVLGNAAPGETLRCGLHTFVYHFGSEAVELSWEEWREAKRHTVMMRPGDSAYIAPLVEHRFSVLAQSPSEAGPNPNGEARGEGRRLLVVRIPGHLTGETLAEFATFSANGRERVGGETMQWY